MSVYYGEIRALIDPHETELLPHGRLLQHVSLIMTCAPEAHEQPTPPVHTSLRPSQARELAFELLALAEHADGHAR